MAELKIRTLGEDAVEALRSAATANGRSLEAELRYRLLESLKNDAAGQPSRIEWLRAGFRSVRSCGHGVFIAEEGHGTVLRISLTHSLDGGADYGVDVERSSTVEVAPWLRVPGLCRQSLATTPADALRTALTYLSNQTELEPPSPPADWLETVPAVYATLVEHVSHVLVASRELKDRSVVIWHTPGYDVYMNMVDDDKVAVMVYRHGEQWSVTNGKASFFPLSLESTAPILDELLRLEVL